MRSASCKHRPAMQQFLFWLILLQTAPDHRTQLRRDLGRERPGRLVSAQPVLVVESHKSFHRRDRKAQREKPTAISRHRSCKAHGVGPHQDLYRRLYQPRSSWVAPTTILPAPTRSREAVSGGVWVLSGQRLPEATRVLGLKRE